jgi:hypothetical protein
MDRTVLRLQRNSRQNKERIREAKKEKEGNGRRKGII